VPKDYAQAFGWYAAATRQGVGSAENGLGTMFAHGEGVVKDEVTAERLFRAAVAHGEHGGLLNIAEMYFAGVNHPSDMAAGYALAYAVADMEQAPPEAASVRDIMRIRLNPVQLARSKGLIEKMRQQDPLAVLDAAASK
jgi:TPR repeat protein